MATTISINGKAIADFSDDELVEINQEQGRKIDELRLMRQIINGELAKRREKARAIAALEAAGIKYELNGSTVSVAVPGVVLEAKAEG
jgi:hypothetical protein